MIYRGTKNGFKAEDFHRTCDNQGSTFGILKTESRDGVQVKISGWYTDIQWTSYGGWIKGSGNSFLFVLRDEINLVKLRCKYKKKEVGHYKDLFCCFGEYDLCIWSDCNINYVSSSWIGKSYE